MRRILYPALILLFISGCQQDRPGRDLIPPETLVPMLMDLHLTYAIQSSMQYRQLLRQADSVDTHSYIFEKYEVNQADFDSTIAWYSRHPELFRDIYDQVVMELSRISDSLNTYEGL